MGNVQVLEGPREAFKHSFGISLTRGGNTLLGILRGVVLGRLLEPSGYGLINVVTLIASYGSLAHLGIRSAAFREIPVLVGEGNRGRLDVVKNTGFTAGALLSFCGAVMVAAYGLLSPTPADVRWVIVLGGFLFFLSGHQSFQEQMVYALKRFRVVSGINTTTALVHTALVVGLAYYAGVYGVLIALGASQVLAVVLYALRVRMDLSWRMDVVEGLRLWHAGAPIFLVSLVLLGAKTVDNWLVINFLGQSDWGIYGFALFVMSFVNNVCSDYVRVLSQYGLESVGRDASPAAFLRDALVSIQSAVWMMPFALGALFIAGPSAIALVFPRYAASGRLVQIFAVSMLFAMVATILDSVLYVLGQNKKRLMLAGINLMLSASLGYVSLGAGYGVGGVAAASTAACVVYTAGLVIGAGPYLVTSRAGVARLVANIFAPAILMGVSIGVVYQVVDITRVIGVAGPVLGVFLFVVVYGVGLMVARQLPIRFREAGWP